MAFTQTRCLFCFASYVLFFLFLFFLFLFFLFFFLLFFYSDICSLHAPPPLTKRMAAALLRPFFRAAVIDDVGDILADASRFLPKYDCRTAQVSSFRELYMNHIARARERNACVCVRVCVCARAPHSNVSLRVCTYNGVTTSTACCLL